MMKMIERVIAFLIYAVVFLLVAISIISFFAPTDFGGMPKGAEALRMVNNLRSIKIASAAHRTENKIAAYRADGYFLSVLEPYMDRSINVEMFPLIIEVAVEDTGSFVGLTRRPFPKDIKEKLHYMAHDASLINCY